MAQTQTLYEMFNTVPTKPVKKITVMELKKLCKERNIKGFSKLKKDELLEILNMKEGSENKNVGENIERFEDDIVSSKTTRKKPKKGKKENCIDRIIKRKVDLTIEKWDDKYYWNEETRIIFDKRIVNGLSARKKSDRQFVLATGYVDKNNTIKPLDQETIHLCKEYNFNYKIPNIIGDIVELKNVKVSELDDEFDDLENMEELGDDEEYDEEQFYDN